MNDWPSFGRCTCNWHPKSVEKKLWIPTFNSFNSMILSPKLIQRICVHVVKAPFMWIEKKPCCSACLVLWRCLIWRFEAMFASLPRNHTCQRRVPKTSSGIVLFLPCLNTNTVNPRSPTPYWPKFHSGSSCTNMFETNNPSKPLWFSKLIHTHSQSTSKKKIVWFFLPGKHY